MWARNLCLICIYILRNNAFQITNEASILAFLQPAATLQLYHIPLDAELYIVVCSDKFVGTANRKPLERESIYI